MASIPTQARSKALRACLSCFLIQTSADWKKNGCPNCESILELKRFPDQIATCTTTQYEGIIALIMPDESWVARWERASNFVRGVYAAEVVGRLPEEIEAKLGDRDIKYRQRNIKYRHSTNMD